MDLSKKSRGPAAGNKECVGLLKQWLAEAKKGQVSHIAIAVAVEPDQFFSQSVGSILYQPAICDTLEDLRLRIRQKFVERWAPYDPKVSADHVTFSLQANNVNYDFLPWLIGAEMHRVRNGAPGPLKVAFYHAEQQAIDLPEAQIQMMKNVIGPLVQAIGGVISPVKFGKGDFSIGYNQIVAATKRGEMVPRFKATGLAGAAMDALLDGLPKPITITLREAKYYEQRNSDVQAWLKFARDLTAQGEYVIFVRDTAKATDELPGFATLPVASENLLMRVALYERAKANLFISNGPATINWHLDTPFLTFIDLDPEMRSDYPPARPEWWPTYHGIEAGTQFPWFTKQQRIVWTNDSYSNLCAAWEEFRPRHETPQRPTHETGQAHAPSEIGA